jgi:hypothetical protein
MRLGNRNCARRRNSKRQVFFFSPQVLLTISGAASSNLFVLPSMTTGLHLGRRGDHVRHACRSTYRSAAARAMDSCVLTKMTSQISKRTSLFNPMATTACYHFRSINDLLEASTFFSDLFSSLPSATERRKTYQFCYSIVIRSYA